jgi:hypothetical protein
MGIDPADRYQNAEEFKRALLGSKSKTQHLPGEYVIDPAPSDPNEEPQPSPIMREVSEPVANQKSGNSKEVAAEPELPVFKPRRKKKKGRGVLAFLFWTLLLLSCAVVTAVRFLPEFVPDPVMTVLSPLNDIEIKLPLIPWLNTPTSLPVPTQTPVIVEATATPVTVSSTATATLSPTQTLNQLWSSFPSFQ